ncbi:hypothetical protein L1049_000420 [Liquidambar formosana]|uniref:Alpha/beta hydrolase fold-3 domain-containing protein n=1 Tax=Liquidambar formosana TaxID=63359 RepID=A0AAP0R5C5_LIQFO
MDSSKTEIAHEFLQLLRIYKDGRVERLVGTDVVPPSIDPKTGVSSKDITIINPQLGNISARLFLPKLTHPNQKIPLLLHFHGSGFCVFSSFNPTSHNYLNTLVSEANIVALSVNYRKAPEHPIPAAYDDSWVALQWAVSHCNGGGPEVWLNDYADFERVFLAGESTGGNIVHNLAMMAGESGFGPGVRIIGAAMVHPYFWGSDPIGSEALDPERKASADRLWPFVCPSNPDNDDPRANPVAEGAPSLVGLGCGRVLVCVAEKDILRDRGLLYYEALGRSGWMGVVKIVDTEGEDHCFHVYDLESEKAKDLNKRLAAFFNRDMPPLL